jgi:lipoprotein-releasing system ATP-binding protein
MASNPVLEAVGLTKTFRETGQELSILAGADLSVLPGEVVAVLGVSGAGKSTLLQILGTLDRPDAGSLRIGGTDALSLGDRALSALRARHLGFVFQFHHLMPDFSAAENVAFPLLIAGSSRRQALERAGELLEEVGLSERAGHFPAELSGGERQRVALARALCAGPDVVLADEPTGNLDPASSARLYYQLRALAVHRGQAFVIATHDMELAGRADRRLRLVGGVLEAC